jgi:hypothetical protein
MLFGAENLYEWAVQYQRGGADYPQGAGAGLGTLAPVRRLAL